ncbi:MAG: DNA-protecting protein DprA [Rhodobacteraceae bacterium]|nr:DNA-protecting protein DprA [Paracoccaceae bacterium]
MTAQQTPSFPTLPKTEQDQIDHLRLIRSRRVGPATYYRLLDEYGTAAEALLALPEVARAAGVKSYSAYPVDWADKEYADGCANGFQLICHGDPVYPALLAASGDAPPVLWALGDTAFLERPSVSLVGARNASSLGIRMTRLIARELGEAGYVVTSGLARGIDAAAHQAALESGTIAVQASGLDVIYPRENTKLHEDISASGLRLSEQAIGLVPQARHFPQRNRIIAALSEATVVVEGAARSGSLITAREAADLGREVMAVPGNPLDGRAAGCNMLIRDGAILVRSGSDIVEALLRHQTIPPEDAATEQTPLPLPAPEQISKTILSLLSPTAIAEDMLIRDSGLPAQDVSQHLITLELEGKIERQPGGMLALAG